VRNSIVINNAVRILWIRNAVVRVDQAMITSNGVGTNGGWLQTYMNNNVSSNTTHGIAGQYARTKRE